MDVFLHSPKGMTVLRLEVNCNRNYEYWVQHKLYCYPIPTHFHLLILGSNVRLLGKPS